MMSDKRIHYGMATRGCVLVHNGVIFTTICEESQLTDWLVGLEAVENV